MTRADRVLRIAERVYDGGGTGDDLVVQLALEGIADPRDVEEAMRLTSEAGRRGDEKAEHIAELLFAALHPR